MAKGQNPQQTAQAVQPTAQAVQPTAQAVQPTAQAVQPTAATAPLLYAGKPPALRAGHNAAAWAAMLPLLPATAATLAALPAVKACGGSKANGLLMVGYCQRRGWLTTTPPQAAQPTPPATGGTTS